MMELAEGTHYYGDDCRPPHVCPVVVNGEHPVEHDGAACWHCGTDPKVSAGSEGTS